MGKYIVKRLAYMLIVLLVVSFLMYWLYNAAWGDRAVTKVDKEMDTGKYKHLSIEEQEQIRADKLLNYQRQYGTDNPSVIVQYARWLGVYPFYDGQLNGMLQGNFGYSEYFSQDVVDAIADPMRITIIINIFATILALGITIPLGIHCAVRRGKITDKVMQIVTIIGYSLPTFLIALLFVWLFVSQLQWFPVSGIETPGNNFTGIQKLLDHAYYLALPLIVMTFCSLGGMTRYVRASMIEALSMDCIKTARAKGLTEKVTIYSHAWRNALIPIVTLVVGWFLGIFSGSVVIENIFAINGMGRIMITALNNNDNDLIMFLQTFYVIMALLGNLIIDIVYGLVDPRVRVNK